MSDAKLSVRLRRHLLPVIALLVLTSCTSVEDFGAYWDKGVVDPALNGRWQKMGLPGEPPNDTLGADTLLFTKGRGSYSLQMINPIDANLPPDVAAQQKKDNDTRLAARTLRIGRSRFFMIRDPGGQAGDGMLERYEIKGAMLLEYQMDNAVAVDLLEAEYPNARNIKKNVGEGRYVVIETFDDEAFRVLSRIADDPEYWFLKCQYKKVGS